MAADTREKQVEAILLVVDYIPYRCRKPDSLYAVAETLDGCIEKVRDRLFSMRSFKFVRARTQGAWITYGTSADGQPYETHSHALFVPREGVSQEVVNRITAHEVNA